MDHIHTETMMRQFPGLIVNAMENGGMAFDEDGDFVDAVDLHNDPSRVWHDFENGDGTRRTTGLSLEDYSEEGKEETKDRLYADEEGDPPVPNEHAFVLNGMKVATVDGQNELELLILEQGADDTPVIAREVFSSPEEEKEEDFLLSELGDELVEPRRIPMRATEAQRDMRDRRNTTKRTISRGEMVVLPGYTYTASDGTSRVIPDERYRKNAKVKYTSHDSHGSHGRKPKYKDHARS